MVRFLHPMKTLKMKVETDQLKVETEEMKVESEEMKAQIKSLVMGMGLLENTGRIFA